jgi:hypothetical protein
MIWSLESEGSAIPGKIEIREKDDGVPRRNHRDIAHSIVRQPLRPSRQMDSIVGFKTRHLHNRLADLTITVEQKKRRMRIRRRMTFRELDIDTNERAGDRFEKANSVVQCLHRNVNVVRLRKVNVR